MDLQRHGQAGVDALERLYRGDTLPARQLTTVKALF